MDTPDLQSAIARAEKAEVDAVSYLRVIADIRRASGLGDAPMLSELAEEIFDRTKKAIEIVNAAREVVSGSGHDLEENLDDLRRAIDGAWWAGDT